MPHLPLFISFADRSSACSILRGTRVVETTVPNPTIDGESGTNNKQCFFTLPETTIHWGVVTCRYISEMR